MDLHCPSKARPSLDHERAARRDGHALVAGVDEVGRGSWAGPVVAAAVILPLGRRRLEKTLESVHDSKQLSREQRNLAYDAIFASGALVSLGLGQSPRDRSRWAGFREPEGHVSRYCRPGGTCQASS